MTTPIVANPVKYSLHADRLGGRAQHGCEGLKD